MSRRRKPRPPFYGARLKCKSCGTIIQSAHRHDFTSCKCGAVSIDGGGTYCRMVTKESEDGSPVFEIIDPGNYEWPE